MGHPRNLAEFPRAWRSAVFALEAKEVVRDEMVGFTERHEKARGADPNYRAPFDWSHDIARLTRDIGSIMSGLPDNILADYNRIRARDLANQQATEAFFKRHCDGNCETCKDER